MEQRNGRIDRKLQQHETVFCHYFLYEQRPEDRILRTIVKKTERIKEELGSLTEVIESKLEKTLAGGIRRKAISELEATIDSADLEQDRKRSIQDDLESARERQNALRTQVEHLRNLLDDSQKSIGLKEEQFRDTISCALRLTNVEPLKTLEPISGGSGDNDGGPLRFAFPAIDQREGADPTWIETMDSLRVPR